MLAFLVQPDGEGAMRTLLVMSIMVWGATLAQAACGDRGGPGYRSPNGKCVGGEAMGRVCGSPPETRCTAERIAADASDAARDGDAVQERKNRQHDLIDQQRSTRP
jgi:hypothetical protein